jgi:hypothetical protein
VISLLYPPYTLSDFACFDSTENTTILSTLHDLVHLVLLSFHSLLLELSQAHIRHPVFVSRLSHNVLHCGYQHASQWQAPRPADLRARLVQSPG